MGFRRKPEPVIPGERCPAVRTNKVHDPAVTFTPGGRITNRGTRTCGRCGRENVAVTQSLDSQGSRYRSPSRAPMTAWYYEPHDAPTEVRSTDTTKDPRERAEYLAASNADAAMGDWRPTNKTGEGQ